MVERRFLEPAGRDIDSRFCEPGERIKRDQKGGITDTVIKPEVKFARELRSENNFSASDYYLTIEKEEKELVHFINIFLPSFFPNILLSTILKRYYT